MIHILEAALSTAVVCITAGMICMVVWIAGEAIDSLVPGRRARALMAPIVYLVVFWLLWRMGS